jgi:hypothetical protein
MIVCSHFDVVVGEKFIIKFDPVNNQKINNQPSIVLRKCTRDEFIEYNKDNPNFQKQVIFKGLPPDNYYYFEVSTD